MVPWEYRVAIAKEMVDLLMDLDRAARVMVGNPGLRRRAPRFWFVEGEEGIVWPSPDVRSKFWRWFDVSAYLQTPHGVARGIYGLGQDAVTIAHLILWRCYGDARKIMVARHRIRLAAEWCRARTEGRFHDARRILREAKRLDFSEDEAASEIALMCLSGEVG